MNRRKSRAIEWGTPVAAVSIAAGLRWLLSGVTRPGDVEFAYLPAVVLLALLAGRVPSLLATALAIVAGVWSLSSLGTGEILAAFNFAAAGLLVSASARPSRRGRHPDLVDTEAESAPQPAELGGGEGRGTGADNLSEAIIETAPLIVLLLGPDGRVLRFNPFMERLSGWTLAEARGRDWFDNFLPVRDRDRLRALFRTAIHEQPTHANVNPILTKSGEQREIEWYDAPLRGPDGAVIGLLCTGQDVTERLRAKAELEASEYHLRLALEAGRLGVWEWDVATDGVSWSRETYGIMNTAEDEFGGKGAEFFRLLHPDDRGLVLEKVEACLTRPGSTFDHDYRIIRPDGSVRWLMNRAHVVADAEGGQVRMIGVVADVTDRHHAEEAMRESDTRFRTLIEDLEIGVVVQDAEGRIIVSNPAAGRLLDLSAPELRGDISREPRWKVVQANGTELPAGEHPWVVAARTLHPSRAIIGVASLSTTACTWLQANATPRLDAGGDLAHVLVTMVDIGDRKRTEDALRESEELFRATFEQAAVGMAHVSLEGRYLRVNGRFTDISGYTREELLARTFQSITHPDDLETDLTLVGRLIDGEIPYYSMEKRYFRKNGEPVWVNLTVALRRTAAGQPLHFISVIEDISERKRVEGEVVRARDEAERALARLRFESARAEEFQRIVEIAGQGIGIAGLNGEMIYLNACFRRLLEIPEEFDISRGSFWNYVPAEDHGFFDETVLASARENGFWTGELELQRGSGRRFPVISNVFLRRDLEGGVLGYASITTDITELKRVEEELREREARLNAILDTAADAIVTIDPEGTIETVNAAAVRLLGYTPEEMIGRNIRMLMPSPYADAHDEYLARYQRTGESRLIGTSREVVARRKDGTTFPIELAVSEISSMGRFTGIIRDLTRRKELEREVVEIASLEQRRIGQDLHDTVGQELTALSMLAGDLADALRTDPATSETLSERMARGIHRCQQQLRVVMRGLLPVPVDRDGLMAALADLAERTRQDSNVACEFDCAEPVAVTDNMTATHLFLIAQEAVHNAVKHARPRGIRITLAADENLIVRVRDDGPGLRPQAGGVGLGLRIMQNRAAIIGARLTIEPAAPTGTVVNCELTRKHDD